MDAAQLAGVAGRGGFDRIQLAHAPRTGDGPLARFDGLGEDPTHRFGGFDHVGFRPHGLCRIRSEVAPHPGQRKADGEAGTLVEVVGDATVRGRDHRLRQVHRLDREQAQSFRAVQRHQGVARTQQGLDPDPFERLPQDLDR